MYVKFNIFRWLVSVGKLERAKKSISVAAKSNGLPLPDHIPVDNTNDEKDAVTNTGIIGLLAHRKLLVRLIVMSLEWIGETSVEHLRSNLT